MTVAPAAMIAHFAPLIERDRMENALQIGFKYEGHSCEGPKMHSSEKILGESCSIFLVE